VSNTLLANETINQIHSLLENGFSQRKTATLADVSVSTVQRLVKRFHAGRTPPVFEHFTVLVNSERYIPPELRGDTLRRYLEVRNQKEKQCPK
jgi:transposase